MATGTATLKAVFKGPSKKGTYHRYDITSPPGFVGNIYVPVDEANPAELTLVVKLGTNGK